MPRINVERKYMQNSNFLNIYNKRHCMKQNMLTQCLLKTRQSIKTIYKKFYLLNFCYKIITVAVATAIFELKTFN